MTLGGQPNSSPASSGWCRRCGVEHRLEPGYARRHARALQQELADLRRIDYRRESAVADARFAIDYLFGPARGQMFGVLECADNRGQAVILRAFSGQYNGVWTIDGWVPPLFDVAAYEQIMIPGDRRLKKLGRKIEALPPGTDRRAELVTRRKHLSRSLMKDLHDLYELRNFRGETAPLAAFFGDTNGAPTGAGDCCGPKLLNHAARNNLRPRSLAEFYWGATNRSGTREHGRFYGRCADKCRPILGFMLCGAQL